jgi:hypothetical protein
MVVFGLCYSSEIPPVKMFADNPRKPDAQDCLVPESARLGRIVLNSSWRAEHPIRQQGVT